MASVGGVRSETFGIGLRAPHVAELLAARPVVGWLEVHAENYMGGGTAAAELDAIRRQYPVSLHGVGLSLGSAEGIDDAHLARLERLVERIEPARVSEHLSWSVSGGSYLNDLLPLPYTEEALAQVAANIDRAQTALGREVLIENPSRYLRFRHSPIPEAEFLAALVRRTGCGLLCDVNNIFVSAQNLNLDPIAYLDALPAASVGEIHLAGHAAVRRDGEPLLIDDHGSAVAPAVWTVYCAALRRFGPVASLVEWDKNLPDLATLLGEAVKAERNAAATLHADADAR
ncbi:MAG TPA: DUF692 domain-containing protein [Stellaceae bacterium]|nr:DUF692 domain-containing protein [Stellaceae bacterium]